MAVLVEEVDPAEAKRLRKEAKRAAKAVEEETVELDPAEAKRLRKAAKRAAAEAVEEDSAAVVVAAADEARRLRQAAQKEGLRKRAAAEAAEAMGGVAAAPPQKKKRGNFLQPLSGQSVGPNFLVCPVAAKPVAPAAPQQHTVAAAKDPAPGSFAERGKLTKTQRKAAKRDAALAQAAEAAAPVEVAAAVEDNVAAGGKSKDKSSKGKGKGKSKAKGGKSKDQGAARNNELTAFVANLPFSVKGPELRQHFEECGQIDRFMLPMVDMVRQLYPKGIAFVQYATKEALDKALALNNTAYSGRVITVTMAGQPSSTKGESAAKSD